MLKMRTDCAHDSSSDEQRVAVPVRLGRSSNATTLTGTTYDRPPVRRSGSLTGGIMGRAKRHNSVGHVRLRQHAGELREAARAAGISYVQLLRVLDGMEPRANVVAYAHVTWGIQPMDWMTPAAV